MGQKKMKSEILGMSKKELSAYLIEITQTDVCKDKEYCNFIVKVFTTTLPGKKYEAKILS